MIDLINLSQDFRDIGVLFSKVRQFSKRSLITNQRLRERYARKFRKNVKSTQVPKKAGFYHQLGFERPHRIPLKWKFDWISARYSPFVTPLNHIVVQVNQAPVAQLHVTRVGLAAEVLSSRKD